MTSLQKWQFWTNPPTHPVRLSQVSIDPPSGGSRGGKSGHVHPSKLAMEFGPLGGTKSNDSTVNISKNAENTTSLKNIKKVDD